MYFELHRTDTRNLIGDYETIEEALGVVEAITIEHGEKAVVTLLLLRAYEDGRPREHVAGGVELLDLTHNAATRTVAA